jgi:hypothetical protein
VPNIGVNTFYPVEGSRREFFDRMHNAHLEREALKKVLRRKLLLDEFEAGVFRVPAPITAKQEKDMIER